MATKKHSTDYIGVRYRKHPTRKCGRVADQYFYIRHRPVRGGKLVEEGVGWASEGWTAAKVSKLLGELKANADTGEGPRTLKEKRELHALSMERDEETRREEIREAVTFADVAARFVAWAKNNKASWADDESRLRLHVLPRLGHKRLADITTQDIEDMKTALQRKKPKRGRHKSLRPATVQQCLALARTVFNFAMNTPMHPNDPTTMIFTGLNPARQSRKFTGGVRPLKFDNRRMRIFTDDEIGKLMEATCVSSQDIHDIALLALDVGLRRREVVMLRPEYFVRETMSLKIFDPKNGQTRTVFIGSLYPQAETMMLNRMAALGSKANWIFPGRWDGCRDKTSITRQFGVVLGWLRINDAITDDRMRAVFHTCRHTHATKMLEKGVDIYTLKDLMGHEDIAVTERYLHLCDAVKRQKALQGGGLRIG